MTSYTTGGPPRYAHQRAGLRKLIDTGGVGALLFDPGLGKTAVTLDYLGLCALKNPQRESRVLVIAPLVAVDTWVMQARTWMSPQVNWWAEALGGSRLDKAEALAARGGRPFARRLTRTRVAKGSAPRAMHVTKALAWDARSGSAVTKVNPLDGPGALLTPRLVMCVINLDTLTSRDKHGSRTMADVMLEAIKRFDPEVVVVDESHKIKSASGNASRLLARLSPHVKRRIILTGTVMPHSPLDVFGQWRFLDPYAFGDKLPDGSRKLATAGGFRNRYAKLGGWMGKEVVGFHRLDEMQAVMARSAVVARKEDALDLPATTDVVIPVELSAAEKKAYAEMKDSLAVQLAGGGQATVGSRLTQALRLRQITAGHLPDDGGTVHTVGTSKASTAASLVHDTLAGESRIVVFAVFTAEIEQLRDRLARKGTTVRVITGATPTAERMAIRREFGSDDPKRIVLLAQVKTLSLAVNELVTASHAVFASLSQQRDDYVQARDRLNRIGQTRPVTFWHLNAPGTVDDLILRAHRNRTSLETAVLQHIQGDNT